MPWSADKAIQQFGRTHRSNQVSSPRYIFMISKLAGEKRFASTVAKRLESLGALTHGDRRATESRDLSQFSIEPKYSRQALETIMNVVQGMEFSPVQVPSNYEGDFYSDVRNCMVNVSLLNYNKCTQTYSTEKDSVEINKFLNRLLGMQVNVQNALFDYFSQTMDAYIRHAKRLGTYDSGIMNLTSNVGKMEILDHREFASKNRNGIDSKTEIRRIAVERGVTFERALEILANSTDKEEGFYEGGSETYVRQSVLLAIKDRSPKRDYATTCFHIYRPNTGLQSKQDTLSDIKQRGRRIDPAIAEGFWNDIYNFTEDKCSHLLWFNKCSKLTQNINCDTGLRKTIHYILSGSILEIWPTIECALPSTNHKLQIVRLNSKEGVSCVGVSIPAFAIENLQKLLTENQLKNEEANKIRNARDEAEIDAAINEATDIDSNTDSEIEFLDH